MLVLDRFSTLLPSGLLLSGLVFACATSTDIYEYEPRPSGTD
jgi:hypothetical protein